MTRKQQGQRKRARSATSIPIDPAKMREFLGRRFLTARAASQLMGRCDDYMSIVIYKRRMSYYAMDDLAVQTNLTVDEVFELVVDRPEWEKFS